MTFDRFKRELEKRIKEYLPVRYKDAIIFFNDVVKHNDMKLTGINIVRKKDEAVPSIYINSYYEDYENGRPLRTILNEIAFMRVEYEDESSMLSLAEKCIVDYEAARNRLVMHICEIDSNMERIEQLIHRKFGDFAAIYYVNISDEEGALFGAGINKEILSEWGITVEQLHEDAVKAEISRGAVLWKIGEHLKNSKFDELTNLLEDETADAKPDGESVYCLTGKNRRHGSSFIVIDETMKKIGQLLEDDYYILPSSVHELIIVPAGNGMKLDIMENIVRNVNIKEVSQEDFLSFKIQYYDRAAGRVMNARMASKPELSSDMVRENVEKYYS